jgi:CRISPR/Cas system-associated exonuclease Cas4 (RecB family)
VNEDALMNAHLRIEEESALLEQAKSELGADPFSVEPTTDLQKCRRCSFQKLCFPKGL